MSDSDQKPGEVLLPFEQKAIPEHYRPYYSAKRHNLFASIQGSHDLWGYFQLLDKNLLTEFENMSNAGDPNRMVPLTLFLNAHAKIRVAIELAFSRCMEEARSIMRDAIETAIYAHYMHADPNLQKIWLSKDDSKPAKDEFSRAFEKDKKTKLFLGQAALYLRWSQLCETGAHTTPQAVVNRFKINDNGESINYQLNYTGVEDREWEPETFTLLQCVSMIEKLVFGDYHARLHLDANLVRNRDLAEHLKEKLRQDLIRKYNISPPGSMPTHP
jgi:hypothetical protein